MVSKKLATGHDALLHASAIPITPGAATRDANGIQLYEWSHPLKQPENDCCGESTDSRYTCCSCFVLAQLESRMGLASYNSVLATSGFVIFVLYAIAFSTPFIVVNWNYDVDFNTTRALVWTGIELVVILAVSLWYVRRTAKLRSLVRARFHLPGSDDEDMHLARRQSTRMLRQMVRHLQCEHAGTFGRVDTLPAYSD